MLKLNPNLHDIGNELSEAEDKSKFYYGTGLKLQLEENNKVRVMTSC